MASINNEIKKNDYTKHLIESVSKKSPVSLEMLNTVILVALVAYIISTSGKNEKTLQFNYWIERLKKDNDIFIRDLVYDVIYQNVNMDLRKEVDFLKADILPSIVAETARVLFNAALQPKEIAELVSEIADTYYPLVITEPITTPTTINNLVAALLGMENGSFFDGVAGVGATCINAAVYAKTRRGNLDIFAQEKLPVLCAVLSVRAFVNGIDSITVRNADVLDDSARLEPFDFSVMFPPLRSTWSFINRLIALLKGGTGRGIIAAPTGCLFNSTFAKNRKDLIVQGVTECIITLPSKILPSNPAPLSLIIINKAKKPRTGILMIEAGELFSDDNAIRVCDRLNEEVIDKIKSLFSKKADSSNVSKWVEFDELMSGDYLLLPSRYVLSTIMEDSDFGRLSVNLTQTQNWHKLTKVCETIYRGVNTPPIAKISPSGQYKIINYTDVQNGEIDVTKLKTYDFAKAPKKHLVQPGDILVSCKGVVIKTCIVPENVDNVVLSVNFIGIRVNSNYSPQFLKCYLDSPVGQAYLKNRQVGTSIITLRNADFDDMPVPQFSVKEKEALCEYEQSYKEINNEIQDLKMQLTNKKWEFYGKIGLTEVMKKERTD